MWLHRLEARVTAATEASSQAILILTPTGRDGAMVTERLAAAGIASEQCADLRALLDRLKEGAGAVVIAQEALPDQGAAQALLGVLDAQEPWSDVPIILLEIPASKRTARAHPTLELFEQANVILLQRPLSPRLLLSAVRAALRARRRQHEMRDLHLQLRRAVELGDVFVSILAHDLRTPVTAAKLAADLILRSSPDARTLDLSQRIVSSLRRMNGMIEQLLDFARFRQGRGVVLQLLAADLGDVTREVLREIEGVNPQASLRLTTAGVLEGWWDADRLAQIVSNLAVNAVDHGAQGEPITVELDGRDPDQVRLRVTSAGVIQAGDIPLLFEPFRRSSQAKGPTNGLGLGLFIAREIARLHGGDISVRTGGPDGMTTFEVTLPRNAKPSQTSVLAAS